MIKPILLFSFSAFCVLSLFAQPTITSASYLGVGSSVTLSEATAIELDTTKGANITWNFSTLQIDQDFAPKKITYINPSTSPFISLFPTANLVYKDEENNDVKYHYFTKSVTGIERLGSAATGSTPTTYTNTQTEMVFPFTIGTSNIDAWESSASSFGGTLSIDGIGYGTLLLPNNRTYTNVQLMRTTMDELIPFVIYYWLSDKGETLAFYSEGDGFFIPLTVRFATTVTTVNVKETALQSLTVQYVNPVQSTFAIQLPAKHEKLTYTITNVLGQVLATADIQPHELSCNISMAQLQQGIYYFTANGKNEHISPITIVKE